MIEGINHLTLAVSDLPRSFRFYVDTLGCRPTARWDRGAYLSAGSLWLCLSLDAAIETRRDDSYTHVAFSVSRDGFDAMCARLRAAGVREWKDNQSEGDSLYLLDPDGHRLELHLGDHASRLAACRAAPYDGMRFFD